MIRVLSFGAGVQSTAALLMSCSGILPRLDWVIFSDTQYESKAVYRHFDWCAEVATAHDVQIHRVTAGDLRQDAIDFRALGHSADGKRHASIPFFLKNPNGSEGMLPRQCTGAYKIDPIERFIRREVLGLKKGARGPKEAVVEQWIGISTDETERASAPGVWGSKIVAKDLFGEPIKQKVWRPLRFKVHHYPFLALTITSERKRVKEGAIEPMSRTQIREWLRANYPDHPVPRSACIGCPYRSNAEWREMRDNDPEAWADAVEFDRAIRADDAERQQARNLLVGTPYVHVQRVPLDQAKLDDGPGHEGPSGCGILFRDAIEIMGCEGVAGCSSGFCGT